MDVLKSFGKAWTKHVQIIEESLLKKFEHPEEILKDVHVLQVLVEKNETVVNNIFKSDHTNTLVGSNWIYRLEKDNC